MLFLWMHVIYFWRDHGCMTERLCIMVTLIPIHFLKMARKSPSPFIPAPPKLHEIQPQKKPKHIDCLLSVCKPILKASQHDFKAFKERTLSVQDEPKNSMPTHPIAKTLIEKFCHVFPKEIPTGLPPKREIQHHIYLIPSSILPNKPAYRMNLKDTNEIQRQVAELQEKGLI